MRNIICLLVVLIALVACKKSNTPPNSTTINGHVITKAAHFIPNWRKDTLICVVMPPSPPYYADTMYADIVGDSSIIYYKGIKYYVWTMSLVIDGKDQFANGEQVYGNCLITTHSQPDSSTAISYDLFNIANPYQYYDSAYNNWTPMYQALQINPAPPFPQYSGLYSTMNKF